MPGLQSDAITTDSHLNQAGKIPATKIVGHVSYYMNQICQQNSTPRKHSLDKKLTAIQFIFSVNFFKVTPADACLILWNTNAISWISIKNFITYPKHSQIHFLTDTLGMCYTQTIRLITTYYPVEVPFQNHLSMHFRVTYCAL